MRTLALVVLVGCAREPPVVANAGGASPPAVPAGWVSIAVGDERLRCASYADDEWQVTIEHGTPRFTQANPREPDTGPPLPFTPAQQPVERGRRHVLAVSDGFLVGYDAGEWGGALYWFSPDGTKAVKLAGENVHGLVKVGPDLVASLEGLSHIVSSEGNVRWVERSGSWRAVGLTALDASPRTFAATADAIYVLTTASLQRVGTRNRKARTIQPTRTAALYADTMAIDRDGAFWIGMRQFVLHMSPAGNRYTETWFVRTTCVRATLGDLDCTCAPR